MAIDLQMVGGIVAGLSALITGAWAWILKNKKSVAETKADVAVSEGQRIVFEQMSNRLDQMQKDIDGLRAELATERDHSRKLEIKLASLEMWIRSQGLTPPTL